jgi:hypothetical protein
VTALPAATINTLPRLNGGNGAVAIKTPSDPSVRLLIDGRTRVVPTWGDLLDAFGGQAPPVFTVANATMLSFPKGSAIPRAGTLVKAADSPMIYLVNDGRRLVPVDSFATTDAMGIRGWSTVSGPELSAYQVAPTVLTPLPACSDGYRAGTGSATSMIDRAEAGAKPSTALGPRACAALPRVAGVLAGPLFVKRPTEATVYRIVGGALRPVMSWGALVQMSGSPAPRIYVISPTALAAMPVGPSMS